MLTLAVVIHCEIHLLFNLSFYSNISGSRIFLMSAYMSAQMWITFFLQAEKKLNQSTVQLTWSQFPR